MKQYERIIMGIDPGTNVMGYGVLGVNGKKPEVIVLGVIELSKFESHYKRLHRIFERVSGLAAQYLPDEVALEAPFFGKNVQSMLKLGRAQGVAMAAVLSRDIPVAEYAPRTIKMAVTGNGQASKEQVSNMLKHLLHMQESEIPKLLDGCGPDAFLRNGEAGSGERPEIMGGLSGQESGASGTEAYTKRIIRTTRISGSIGPIRIISLIKG